MRPFNEKLKADILDSARQIFLRQGFRGAQLREIAEGAGATTGAIYRYFKDKDALFEALVEPWASEFLAFYEKAQADFAAKDLTGQLTSLPEISDHGQIWMMRYIYEHFEAFKLIVCCSEGTPYERYVDSLIEIEAKSGIRLTTRMLEAGMEIQPLDDELIYILSGMLFSGMFDTVRRDMPEEKAFAYMENLADFYTAGWFKLLGLSPA